MASKLVNVRLDDERLRKVQQLREAGVALSEVVREAIDERYHALETPGGPDDVRALIDRIVEQYPDRGDARARAYDVHDRRASRAAIVRTLRRRRR